MRNPVVSIIVPVYNTEQYVGRCIQSILLQSFTDFELILIDDGSKDDSGKICEEYAKSNDKIRVFHNERNRGVSFSRNVGIQNSLGKYIIFIDSDDEIEEYFVEALFQSRRCDLVIGGYKIIDYDNKNNIVVNEFPENQAYDKSSISRLMHSYIKDMIMVGPIGKLYKTEIIKNNGIWFDERYKFGEDILFNFRYYTFIESMSVVGKSGYINHYYHHHTLINLENAISLISDLQKVWQVLVSKYFSLADVNQYDIYFVYIKPPFYLMLRQKDSYNQLLEYFSNRQVILILENVDIYDTNLRLGYWFYKYHLLRFYKFFFWMKLHLFR